MRIEIWKYQLHTRNVHTTLQITKGLDISAKDPGFPLKTFILSSDCYVVWLPIAPMVKSPQKYRLNSEVIYIN